MTRILGNTVIIVGLLLVPSRLLARQNGQPASGSDPIEKALAAGTDKVEGMSQQPGLERRNPRYQVNTGDVMVLNFNFTPEFNQTVTVQPDGFITLQGIGDMHVAGETMPEIHANLMKAYSKILRQPVISVTLQNFQSPYFLALGQVSKPGKYDLRGDTSLSDAVAIAGGFTSMAKDSQVLLFRRVNNSWVSVRKVNLKHMLRSGDLNEDLYLQPGDMLYVPQNLISKVKPFLPLPALSFILGSRTIP